MHASGKSGAIPEYLTVVPEIGFLISSLRRWWKGDQLSATRPFRMLATQPRRVLTCWQMKPTQAEPLLASHIAKSYLTRATTSCDAALSGFGLRHPVASFPHRSEERNPQREVCRCQIRKPLNSPSKT